MERLKNRQQHISSYSITDKATSYSSMVLLARMAGAITLSHARPLTLPICKSETPKPFDFCGFTADT
jgi:hypothetical protein